MAEDDGCPPWACRLSVHLSRVAGRPSRQWQQRHDISRWTATALLEDHLFLGFGLRLLHREDVRAGEAEEEDEEEDEARQTVAEDADDGRPALGSCCTAPQAEGGAKEEVMVVSLAHVVVWLFGLAADAGRCRTGLAHFLYDADGEQEVAMSAPTSGHDVEVEQTPSAREAVVERGLCLDLAPIVIWLVGRRRARLPMTDGTLGRRLWSSVVRAFDVGLGQEIGSLFIQVLPMLLPNGTVAFSCRPSCLRSLDCRRWFAGVAAMFEGFRMDACSTSTLLGGLSSLGIWRVSMADVHDSQASSNN